MQIADPIRISAVIGRGFRIFFRNFPTFFGLILIVGALQALVHIGLERLEERSADIAVLTGSVALMLLSLLSLVAGVLSIWVNLTCIRVGLDSEAGFDARPLPALRATASLILPQVGVAILTAIAVVVGYMLLVVPGIIATLALLVASVALVDRQGGVIAAMRESWRLTKHNRWRILLLLIVGSIATMVLLSAGMTAAGMSLNRLDERFVQYLSGPMLWAVGGMGTVIGALGVAMLVALYLELKRANAGLSF